MFNYILSIFGFRNTGDFLNSFIHLKLLPITLPIATLSSGFEEYFGLKIVTAISFICLLALDLVSGIVAILIRKKKLPSKRLARFGFKVTAWMLLFFIIHSLKMQFVEKSPWLSELFDWLFSLIFVYVSFEYLISVLEHFSFISGKSNEPLTKMLRKKMKRLLGNDKKPEEQ